MGWASRRSFVDARNVSDVLVVFLLSLGDVGDVLLLYMTCMLKCDVGLVEVGRRGPARRIKDDGVKSSSRSNQCRGATV